MGAMAVSDHEVEACTIYSLSFPTLRTATTAVRTTVQKSAKLIVLQAKRPRLTLVVVDLIETAGDASGEIARSLRLIECIRILMLQD